ncbi:Metallo-hydrolase/oxidoreductase [Lophiostoma macrostomum CBS 122681]|uniref:Metallo-hydrolase/oxidoreductase n=1 Tax=Lophiostoma macrostomum CBS 122681 TaxID=1314788 RepID=A0A6A6TTS8_9PLEO|nr:Metallo-hydrolase/oxidoreductase [Lophiostoma macrostomum CBS 122681]
MANTDFSKISSSLPTLRHFQPHGTTGIHAYYDGRTCPWHSSNWYDETLALGVATYSIVSGDSALLFDAGLTPAHAEYMLTHVRSLGAVHITTVYSHYHSDHIAGASALQETRIIAHARTKEKLAHSAEELRNPGPDDGPSIDVVLPAETYEERMTLRIGSVQVELLNFEIHTQDSTALFLPAEGLLFAGDMLEDTVTYVAEPEHLGTHLRELERLAGVPVKRILPAHGCPRRIEEGGFGKEFIEATGRYLRKLDEPVEEPGAWTRKVRDVVREDLEGGVLVFCEAYEGVHEENVEALKEIREESKGSSPTDVL